VADENTRVSRMRSGPFKAMEAMSSGADGMPGYVVARGA
jgi:hypothetical protein